jgi:hypothetical protein
VYVAVYSAALGTADPELNHIRVVAGNRPPR